MASNTGNKRIAIKWIRDGAKSAYEKASSCYICETTENLELHHLRSLTLLFEAWAKANKYDISTDDGVLAIRDEFILQHKKELYEEVYTLCNNHHVKLHGVYGKIPAPSTVDKQIRWIGLQKDKANGVSTGSPLGFFSKFT